MQNINYARPALITAAILLIPLIGMQVSDGWNWGIGDFVIMGALLFGAGLVYEFAARRVAMRGQRWAVGIAVVAAVLLIWIELAVGAVSQLIHLLFPL